MESTLKGQQFRFYHFGPGRYGWAHPLDGLPFVADCTDMNESEFEEYVRLTDDE